MFQEIWAYTMILWSGSSHDWSIKDANKVYRNTFQCAADGAIILYHDIYDFTADAIERVVPDLISQGYQLVTISELIAMDEKSVSPGERYGGWAPVTKDDY
jgi:peptidoglycan/xylan/chitin deacetylase (PgdA/CDA1 family)